MNELARYLAKTQETQAAFGVRVGVTDAIVCMWLSGARRPNLTSAFAIQRATDGEVPATLWLKRKR